MTRESAVEARLVRKVKAAGGMSVKLAPTTKGVPDRLVLLNGHMHLVELKTDTGRVSPAQRLWAEKARKTGVYVWTLYGTDAVDEWIREVTR